MRSLLNFSFPLNINKFFEIGLFFSEFEGTAVLCSGGISETAQTSFIGLFPFESVTIKGDLLTHSKGLSTTTHEIKNSWEALEDTFFSNFFRSSDLFAFGWLSYQMGFSADPDYHFKCQASSTTPDAFWQKSIITLIFDHQIQECSVKFCLDAPPHSEYPQKIKHWIDQLSTKEKWLFFLENLQPHFVQNKNSKQAASPSSNQFETFIKKVEIAQEHIRAGDIYQVNLSQVFYFDSIDSPFQLFHQMCINHPTPFSAYFNTKETIVLSMSPERFLNKKGNTLETRPIKGTIKRGQTESEDVLLKERLLNSEKERAELLMITDLMRNDLGKVSQPGSVCTLKIWKCETYSKVFHLISIIQSLANLNLKPLEIVRSCFPGGSITGCPKLRSMEIINELEEIPRGLYTGSIGYFKGDGNFDLNIAIRTLVIPKNGPAMLHLGSGIVYDSDPSKEYQETLIKGAFFFESINHQEASI